jgi:hypothetical protein
LGRLRSRLELYGHRLVVRSGLLIGDGVAGGNLGEVSGEHQGARYPGMPGVKLQAAREVVASGGKIVESRAAFRVG